MDSSFTGKVKVKPLRRIALYESVGFVEYGRNPKGFRSRLTGWQEVLLVRLELGGQSAM